MTWRLANIFFSFLLAGAGFFLGWKHSQSFQLHSGMSFRLVSGALVGYAWWSFFWALKLFWPRFIGEATYPGATADSPYVVRGADARTAAVPYILVSLFLGPLGAGLYGFARYVFDTFSSRDE